MRGALPGPARRGGAGGRAGGRAARRRAAARPLRAARRERRGARAEKRRDGRQGREKRRREKRREKRARTGPAAAAPPAEGRENEPERQRRNYLGKRDEKTKRRMHGGARPGDEHLGTHALHSHQVEQHAVRDVKRGDERQRRALVNNTKSNKTTTRKTKRLFCL
jgi:hypothetical protein